MGGDELVLSVKPLFTKQVDRLNVRVYADRREMGRAAGESVAERLRQLLDEQAEVRMVFAAAPSQLEMLDTLCQAEGIDWSRVTAFHMDEYIGLPEASPQRFAHFLHLHLFDRVHPGTVHLIEGNRDPHAECERYARLIRDKPLDIICLGIGENGHLAFNDPPVADFEDPEVIKRVALDPLCRRQQVNDGCFDDLESVPAHALTLTIPTLMSGRYLVCAVPGESKRLAVAKTLNEPVSTSCPASILRYHPDCTLYLDLESSGVTYDLSHH
jgi:glucosamine-6-phosphate deaminase